MNEHDLDQDEPKKGINLVLVYALMAVFFLAAMVIAGLIVLPFYRHR